MSLDVPRKATAAAFAMWGEVRPLVGLAKAVDGYVPRRQLGGWAATYGKVGPNGGIVPTEDREGHVFEAAAAVGRIDFSDYLKKGIWNDTHGPVNVGVPTLLEHHGETSELAKAHGKVGWWTEGHLFDREDPRSWQEFTAYTPTPKDLDRADYYWDLANRLRGLPRDLGFSAEGKMLLSPCGKRIIWAAVNKVAVCEMPQNPDATAQPLRLAVPVTASMIDADPCETCTCPPHARCKVVPLGKGVATDIIAPIAPQDLEGSRKDAPSDKDRIALLVKQVQQRLDCSEEEARRLVLRWARSVIQRRKPQGSEDGRTAG